MLRDELLMFLKPLEGSWLKNLERESSGVQPREERNEGIGSSHIYRVGDPRPRVFGHGGCMTVHSS